MSSSSTELTFFQAKEIKISRGFPCGYRRDKRDGFYTRQILIVSADGSEFQINVHSVTGQAQLPVVAVDKDVV